MALNAGMIDFGEKPIVIFDLDGTTTNGAHREHHLEGNRKDWDTYFSLMGLDKPVDIVVRWIRVLSREHTVCLVSGRPDTYQRSTIAWLDVHGVPFDYLFMRGGGDRRSDVDVKSDILAKMPKSQILFAVDDRLSVISNVWRKHGVKCIPVRCNDIDFE